MFNIISNMLFIITCIFNTNKLVISWINEYYQISHKLYNKGHTYFLRNARNKNTKMVYF